VRTSRSAAAAGDGDDADRARESRQRLLVRRVEQALGLQPRLELLERLEERAAARLAHLLDHELVAAARLVERHARAHLDLHAVLGRKSRNWARVRNIAHWISAAVSLRQKYQWPDGAFLTPKARPRPRASRTGSRAARARADSAPKR
jgi:hypothetical protein